MQGIVGQHVRTRQSLRQNKPSETRFMPCGTWPKEFWLAREIEPKTLEGAHPQVPGIRPLPQGQTLGVTSYIMLSTLISILLYCKKIYSNFYYIKRIHGFVSQVVLVSQVKNSLTAFGKILIETKSLCSLKLM